MRWSYDTSPGSQPTQFHGDPLLTDELVITPSDGPPGSAVYAFDRATGRLVWKTDVDGLETDLQRHGESAIGVTSGGDLIALDLTRGEVRWRFTPPGSTGRRDRRSTPALLAERVFYGASDGRVYALAAESGEQLWDRDLGSPVSTPVRAIGEHLLVGVRASKLFQLDSRSGEVLAELVTPEPPHDSLVPTRGALIVLLGRSTLAAVDPELSGIHWQRETEGMWSSFYPLAFEDFLIAGDSRGRLVALRPEDGAQIWTHTLEGSLRGLGLAGSDLFVGTIEGTLYALAVPDFSELAAGMPSGAAGETPAPAAAEEEGDEAAIRRLLEEIIAADNRGDLETVADLYADDALLLPPGSPPVRGREAIRAHYTAIFNASRLKLAAESLETLVAGDWAIDRGVTAGLVIPKETGEPRTVNDAYLMILRRDPDGAWRIWRLIWNAAE